MQLWNPRHRLRYRFPRSIPSPPRVPDPGTRTSSSQQAGMRVCRSCGNVINPGDKFCGKCLAKVVDATSESPAPVKYRFPWSPLRYSPSQIPDPGTETIPAQHQGIRLCRSCGYVINPGDKFCKKCLAKVVEDIPVTPPQTRQSTSDIALSSVSPPACKSCGSPLGGTEKFCGICGTPVAPVSPAPAAMTPGGTMTCTGCGTPISATTGFCGGCGMAVGAVATPKTIPPASPGNLRSSTRCTRKHRRKR